MVTVFLEKKTNWWSILSSRYLSWIFCFYLCTGFLGKTGIKALLPDAKAWRGSYAGSGNVPTVTTIRGQATLFPDRLRVPLKWTLQSAFSISSGVGSQLSVIANSINDPGGSGAATQPYGYDVLATMYGRYRVLAAAIEVSALTNSGDSSLTTPAAMTNVTLWPSMTATSFVSDEAGAAQHPYGKRFNLSTQIGVNNIIRSYMSTAKMYGDNILAPQIDDAYAALINANPTKIWYFNIMVTPTSSAGATSSSPIINITLIQYVELFARNSLSST